MIPLNLELVNFFSHKNSVIDFSQFSSALLIGNIEGNYDTSNGSGKSSIFESILWCLFNKSRAASMDDIISWGENYCKVEFTFKNDGDVYKILRKRSRVNSATYVDFSKMKEDGSWVDISGSTSSLTNTEIERVIKVDFKTFVNSAYFRQDDISEFAVSDAAKKKSILKSIVDISKWDEYEESAKDSLKELKLETKILIAKLEGYDDLVTEYESTYEQLRSSEVELGSLNKQREKDDIYFQMLSSKYQEMKKTIDTTLWDKTIENIENLKCQLGVKTHQLKNSHFYLNECQDRKKTIELNRQDLLNKIFELKIDENVDILISELNEKRMHHQLNLNLASAIINDLKKHDIIAGTCYVCRQDINDTLYESLISQHNLKIEEQSKIEVFNKNKIKEFETLQIEYNILSQNNKIKNKYLQTIGELDNKIQGLDELILGHSEKSVSLQKEIDVHHNELNISNHILDSIRNDSFKDLQKQLSSCKNYLLELSKKIEKANMNHGVLLEKTSNMKNKIDSLQESKKDFLEKQKKISILEKTIKLLGKNGIQTILLNAIIEDLEKTANEILSSICNEPFTIYLDTQRVGSDGVSIVDTLDLRVKKDGVIQNFKSLSSGEQFRISLALRIALSEISSRHGGSALEFLLLDEINSPLDRHGTESLFINVIKSLEKRYKILVITHNDSLKEKFSNIIDVTKVNGESSVSFFSI
jgi:DNA repair exonuclease SbcCD ATPase subunit